MESFIDSPFYVEHFPSEHYVVRALAKMPND